MSTTADLTVPVRPCTPWCEDGRETHADQHPDDRSCWSTYQVVPLSQHRAETVDGAYRHPYLNVYLRRRVGEDEPLIYVHSEETDEELRLTLPEARELNRLLGTLLTTAEVRA